MKFGKSAEIRGKALKAWLLALFHALAAQL
jgi:hypothetical protein